MFHFRESSGTARAIASRRRASPNTHPSDRSDRGLGLRLGLRRKPLETAQKFEPGKVCPDIPLLGQAFAGQARRNRDAQFNIAALDCGGNR